MLDVKNVIRLANAGFTAEEIEDILAPKDTNGSAPEPAASPEPVPAEPAPAEPDPVEPIPAESEPETDPIEEMKTVVNNGFQSIINALQTAAVGSSRQPMPAAKTSEDILAEIISPYSEGGKK